jgi:hypothetical protein
MAPASGAARLKGDHSPGRKAVMNTRCWLSVAAVTIASATLALAGVGSDALASSTTATGTIKACYKTGTALVPLDHVGNSVACPTGDSALTWNKVGPQGPAGPQGPQGAQGPAGPQGPAGVSQGISTSSNTNVPLNQGNTLVPVLTINPVPVSGTYYLNASVMLTVGSGDGVACIWGVNGNEEGTFATVGNVPNLSYQTVALSASLALPAGTDLQVLCSGYNSVSQTSFYNGAITGVLINSPSGNAQLAAPPVRHGLPPKL